MATECFGNALSIACEEGQRIKVIDDFFGVSGSLSGVGGESCQYHPGDCTVTNDRYSSLIHRFCEGKGTCKNFQVDRRYCGLNHTNYEQVEYECVSGKSDTNVKPCLLLLNKSLWTRSMLMYQTPSLCTK